MKRKKELSTIIFMVFILFSFTFYSCTEETTEPTEQSPDIPPQSSLIIDFSQFPDTVFPAPPGNRFSTDSLERTNWQWASFNAGIWNVVLTITLIAPVTAFKEAFRHKPVLQNDGSWLWSYNVPVGGIIHTVKLYGNSVTSGVEWKMLLSKQGAYQDFEWLTGFSNLPLTAGTWTLKNDPTNQTPFLFIEWNRDAQQNTANIKYTNIVPNAPANGSYIFYGTTTGTTYNRFYDLFGQEENRTINIEWNYENLFGRVKDPIHFGDQDWHCWDEQIYNVTCP